MEAVETLATVNYLTKCYSQHSTSSWELKELTDTVQKCDSVENFSVSSFMVLIVSLALQISHFRLITAGRKM